MLYRYNVFRLSPARMTRVPFVYAWIRLIIPAHLPFSASRTIDQACIWTFLSFCLPRRSSYIPRAIGGPMTLSRFLNNAIVLARGASMMNARTSIAVVCKMRHEYRRMRSSWLKRSKGRAHSLGSINEG